MVFKVINLHTNVSTTITTEDDNNKNSHKSLYLQSAHYGPHDILCTSLLAHLVLIHNDTMI